MSFRARFGIAAALAVFVVAALSGTLASAGAAGPGNPDGAAKLCNITSFPGGKPEKKGRALAPTSMIGGAGGALAHGSGLPKKLAVFVLEKAVGANIERWALTGMGSLLKMLNLSSISPKSDEEKIFNQLQAINARLAELEGRIAIVGESVNKLTANRHRKDLNEEIKGICRIADRQMFYYQHLQEAVETGEELGKALKRADPSLPPGSDPVVTALRDEAQREIKFFIDSYDPALSSEQIGTLRTALVPPKTSGALATTTVLQTFGTVIIDQNRFLRSEHSKAIRDLYNDVLEIRALATWMEAEFFRTQNLDKKEARTWESFHEDYENAANGLPPMIPPGVIVDMGDEPRATTTDDRPMWFAPTSRDLGWLPTFNIRRDVFHIDEVGHEISRLNEKGRKFRGWHAPHKQEFVALISRGCRANSNPNGQTETLVGCKSVVPGDANIADYLQGINKKDKTWQELFCRKSPKRECPPDSGPKGIREKPHAFIWTSDKHIQRLKCRLDGVEAGTRTFTYAGFLTLGPVKHEVFPHFPGKVNADCVEYLRSLIGDPEKEVKRNHLFEGVLLATRNTAYADKTRFNRIYVDYMAQTLPGS